MSRFSTLFAAEKPIIGMIHLGPLPDYPESRGLEHLTTQALKDLRALEAGGVDGVLVENEYDRPHRVIAGPETIAAMTAVTAAVVQESQSAVVGCEILLNDPQASLAVAKASGARFVRSDYFVDSMSRPEYGEFAIDAEGLIAFRSSIDADDILLLVDIQVKYASMIEPRPLSESASLACEKQADGVIVSGDLTGDAPAVEQLQDAARGVAASGLDVPVLVGSGLDAANANALLANCAGAIVGTSLMHARSIDPGAVVTLMAKIGRGRS